MGSGNRLVQSPDGQWMNHSAYDQYMQGAYNPQQDFQASANAPIPGMAPTNFGMGGSGGSSGRLPGMAQGVLGNAVGLAVANGLTPEQWRGLLPAGAGNQMQGPPAQSGPVNAGFNAAGPYASQALGMAGLLNPHTPPGDTYPNGLLGGKGGAWRPGGK